MLKRKSEARRGRIQAVLDNAAVAEGTDGPYATVTYTLGLQAARRYYVLLGAALHVPSAPNAPFSHVGLSGQRLGPAEAAQSKLPVFCVSAETRLGPPYVTAVACTCPDWLTRSGLAASDRAPSRDAAVGCKHMMLCNVEVMQQAPVTLGPAAASSSVLGRILTGADDARAAPSSVSGGAFSVLGPLPGELAETRGKKSGVRVDQEDDQDMFLMEL